MKFPHIIKDFATDKELDILYEFSSTTDLWCFSGDERWDGRNCYLTELIDQVGVESPALKTCLLYQSSSAEQRSSGSVGCRRRIKKKKQ